MSAADRLRGPEIRDFNVIGSKGFMIILPSLKKEYLILKNLRKKKHFRI